ncbi:MAG: serine protease [Nitrospirae bacterium]|nr:serine protease [Nitrospirota bacterium]MCL5422763.1 serine protease [Nitrospirota bacterium]
MADISWHEAVELINPYVVRIWTPQGSGTGFVVSTSKATPLCAIATAAHVINHAHYWEEPLRIEHSASGKTVLLRPAERAINVQPGDDTAAIIFERSELTLPDNALSLTPKGKYFKPGVEIGWLGYPAIPRASLCFFSGRISAWIDGESAYLVDGVAINGVSGGPAFVDASMLIGVVSAYIPNRATGEPLPGLAVIRSVNQFHDIVERFSSIDQAKAEETPPGEAPPVPAHEGENPAQGPRMST